MRRGSARNEIEHPVPDDLPREEEEVADPPPALSDRLREQALLAGVQPDAFAALMNSVPASDRARLRDLCRSDLAQASEALQAAVREGRTAHIIRHVHLLISVGETAGAMRLGREARHLQDLISSGRIRHLDAPAHLVAAQVALVCRFLDQVRVDDEGRIG